MKHFNKLLIAAAAAALLTGNVNAQTVTKQDWGDFKLWLDPGHSMRENMGMYNYTEAQKVLRVGLATREYLMTYTTIDTTTVQMTRDDDQDNVSLEERSDMANAWGADFFYSIHSDAASDVNQTLFLFGGWYENGTPVEKTPNGGKAFAEILDPHLTGVMYQTTSRGSWYDRYYYDRTSNHTNHRPWLSVNRRTNMASMLSEGGFHTLPVQQALNINDSYKRLEAFGTFRAIMEYRGLTRPDKVMLVGVITNSETGEALNGVKVNLYKASDPTTVIATVTTDTYESLFKNYSTNPDLIHNGFFLFEGLEPGGQYKLTYECDRFDSMNLEATLKTNPQGNSADNVTWANVAMTSNAPAVVSSINVTDASAVNVLNDIVITFSRKMDKTTVEQAFAMSDNGAYTLSWDNDYTLRVNINNLVQDHTYTLTISGSIAKNSQTNQYLDGDADGTAGGDYTFTFTTIPPDVEAPYIVSTTPAENSTMLYTLRPAIRIEYNEELSWNEDEATDVIVLENAEGEKVDGSIAHNVVNGASVIHLYPTADLELDKAYKVTVKGGLKDLAGNTSEGKTFVFLTEYRPVEATKVLDDGTVSNWWAPDGSGSTSGTTSKTGAEDSGSNYIEQSSTHSSTAVDKSIHMHYKFDADYAGPWNIREYRSANQYNYDATVQGYVLQAYVFGDGTNNKVAHQVRIKGDGIKRNPTVMLNYRGWDIMAWDINNSGHDIEVFTGSADSIKTTDTWCYDSFWLVHQMTADQGDMYKDNDGYDDDGNAILWQDWEGDIIFDDYKYVKYGQATQTASIDDISMSGVTEVKTGKIVITSHGATINVTASSDLLNVSIYALNGATTASVKPAATTATIDASSLAPGIYVVKAVTATETLTRRVIVH